MNRNSLLTVGLPILSLIVGGCVSSTSFKPWSGPSEFKGTGGTVRKVDGIDIWENGDPARRYRLLGLIDQSTLGDAGAMLLLGGNPQERIVKEAKKRGGDAIIVITSTAQITPANQGALASVQSKVAVIRYLDGEESASVPTPTSSGTNRQEVPSALPASTQDIASHFGQIKASAEWGDANAEYLLGWMYLTGTVAHKDDKEGVSWIKKSAYHGNSEAQNKLGRLYLEGELVEKNYTKAIDWLRAAAEKGLPDAQVNLGACYADGSLGVPKDHVLAVQWFRRAANQGSPSGQGRLGAAYALGLGVPADKIEAYKWLSLAATREEGPALGLRDQVAKGLSPDQVEEAKQRSAAFVPRKE